MADAVFRPKADTFEGDYDGVIRNAHNEMPSGLHYHDFYEFVIYLGDAGVFRTEEGDYPVGYGDIVLIDMFKPHTLIFNTDVYYERFSLSIDPILIISFSTPKSGLIDLFHSESLSCPVRHVCDEDFLKYIELIKKFAETPLSYGQDILEKSLIHQLLAYAYNDFHSYIRTDETLSLNFTIIAKVVNYINEHLNEEISLKRISSEIGYSEYYISRLFRQSTGRTLTSFIQEKRIETACRLLVSNRNIGSVAAEVGFNNYSHFYKTFKKFKGCSPAEFIS